MPRQGGWDPLGPLNDAMRIAVPLVINQRNIDAEKERADQIYMQKRNELLQQATKAQNDVALQSAWKLYEGSVNNADLNDPAQLMKVKASAANFEKILGSPIIPRDETGEYAFMRLAKPDKEPTEKKSDLRVTLEEMAQLPPGSPERQIYQKKLDAVGDREREPKSSRDIVRTVDMGDKVLIQYRDGSTEERAKGASPQRGEQGTKPPKDHVFDPESGTMKLIEGTPTHQKQRGEQVKDEFRMNTITSKLDLLEKSAQNLIEHPGLPAISGRRSYIPDFMNQDAEDASTKMDSLGAQLATQAIAEMREASKTGGALGNTSDADILLLKSSVESLKKAQSLSQKKDALQNIIDVARGSKNRMQKAYQSQWGDWNDRVFKKPIKTENLDIKNIGNDELMKKLGIGK